MLFLGGHRPNIFTNKDRCYKNDGYKVYEESPEQSFFFFMDLLGIEFYIV